MTAVIITNFLIQKCKKPFSNVRIWKLHYVGAIDKHQLRLFCQPQVDHTGRLVGGEILLRWFLDGDRTPVMPGDFIPLAEERQCFNCSDRRVGDNRAVIAIFKKLAI
jgi:EAL domain-containing protein (putative c-di-GMP-specific phosphodiesterase class I)